MWGLDPPIHLFMLLVYIMSPILPVYLPSFLSRGGAAGSAGLGALTCTRPTPQCMWRFWLAPRLFWGRVCPLSPDPPTASSGGQAVTARPSWWAHLCRPSPSAMLIRYSLVSQGAGDWAGRAGTTHVDICSYRHCMDLESSFWDPPELRTALRAPFLALCTPISVPFLYLYLLPFISLSLCTVFWLAPVCFNSRLSPRLQFSSTP
jgi:hypothetical protein